MDIVVFKRYFQRNTTKSPPTIIATIKPAILDCDVHAKEANNSARSSSRDRKVLTELIINRRSISKIMSNGVLTMIIL